MDIVLIQKTVQQCAASRWVDFPDYADFFHASLVCANFSNAKTDGVEEESDMSAATATADGIDHFKSWCFTLENVQAIKILSLGIRSFVRHSKITRFGQAS
jgi:DNA (cytosine-5)-methyltransferase 1